MFRSRNIIFYLLCSFALAVAVSGTVVAEIDPSKVVDVREKLEAELKDLENQIAKEENIIKEKQMEATSLARDIAILNAEINKARLAIRARTIRITELADSIEDKKLLIKDLEEKLENEKSSLSELLRRMNELDSVSLVEIILAYDSLSEFFREFDYFEFIQKDLQASFNQIKDNQSSAKREREELEQKRSEEMELKNIQELEKKRLEEREAEKENLLKITKGEEARYQAILAQRKKDAATIRSQLFLLRGSPNIPFEKAVEYANAAFKATGVRPAFLLGVIAEESNLGANVGTGNWKVDLSHPRCKAQKQAFLEITSELGLNPDMMPVSRKTWYGYCGGAMGPAQFMPTTWRLYQGRISETTGHHPPNPWDPKDAFIAAALLLKDNGAAAGGYTAERRAALRYLAGSHWNNPSYSFYGDDVMALARKYQEQIDIISL
jgi:peptidoglycan hydrolase CwlO-like protein